MPDSLRGRFRPLLGRARFRSRRRGTAHLRDEKHHDLSLSGDLVRNARFEKCPQTASVVCPQDDKGGTYVGSEVHLHVQARDFSWQGDTRRIHEGPEIPKFIRAANLVPAGSHRGEAVMPTIMANADKIDAIIWDRAYSVLPHENYAGRLLSAGIWTVFELTKYQRENYPVSEHVIWRDGTPLHVNRPTELLNLTPPPMNATADEIKKRTAKYDERARWRWNKIAGPDEDGYTRWQCPFHAGRLKSRDFRQAKISKEAPLVFLPDDVTKCCEGTITLDASYTRLMQAFAIPYGTSAWRWAYSRRNMVETGNSYFGGSSYMSLERTYTRLMGHKNKKLLLALMVAGLNQFIARSWRGRMEAEARVVSRGKSRKNTFAELGATTVEAAASKMPGNTAASPPQRT